MVDQSRQAGANVQSGGVQPPGAEMEDQPVRGRTQREIVWSRFKRHRLALVGGVVLIVLYLMAIFGPYLSPYGFAEQNFTAINQAPSLEHPMGTDRLGRDNLTRVIHGGQVSLLLGLGVGVGSTVVGAAVGIVAGYFGRYVDTAAMGLTDFALALPFIPLLIVAGSIFQFTAFTITLVLVVLLWTTICRLVRGQVLSIRDMEYVQAAKAIGVSSFRTMFRHVLPNVVGVMVVQATLVAGTAILIESALSFLGVGIQPPTPSWGNMLQDARTTMRDQWWLTVFPGMMIFVTVLCINFLGDGLRDALDPKSRE